MPRKYEDLSLQKLLVRFIDKDFQLVRRAFPEAPAGDWRAMRTLLRNERQLARVLADRRIHTLVTRRSERPGSLSEGFCYAVVVFNAFRVAGLGFPTLAGMLSLQLAETAELVRANQPDTFGRATPIPPRLYIYIRDGAPKRRFHVRAGVGKAEIALNGQLWADGTGASVQAG